MSNRYLFIDEGKQHLHTLDGKPLVGTTTALGIIAKVLTWWASGKACEVFGWRDPKKIPENDRRIALEEGYKMVTSGTLEDYGKTLQKAYAAHSQSLSKSADKGTDMHAELERYVKYCLENYEGRPVATKDDRAAGDPVVIFAAWSTKNIKRFLFSELHCYSEPLWIGGVADFGYEDLEGNYVLGDFKSSDKVYFNHLLQCGGYDLQIEENGGLDKEGNLIFKPEKPFAYYAVMPFGMKEPTIQTYHDPSTMKQGFSEAVSLYKKNLFFTKAQKANV